MGLDTAIFFLFLFCVAILQARLPEKGRVALLLFASLMFYAFSSLSYLLLLLVLCTVNYGLLLGLKGNNGQRRRNLFFATAVFANLAILVAFKYTPELLRGVSAKLGWPGAGGKIASLAIPLGLSYFTFQMLACVTDAYRQTWQVGQGFRRFALFSFFFPQITSGPIPRAAGLFPQLAVCPTAEDRLAGLRWIAYGLFKKFVVANRLSVHVAEVFTHADTANSISTFMAICFNAMQLYADFSGYVDIAIGSARFLGIRLDPNFDRPYLSTSVTEFWRRWHMTLSFWLRDYLYMPLVIRIRSLGKLGIALALIFTFAICGIWHGAAWTFLLFGVAQGVAMTFELLTKSWRTKRLKTVPKQVAVWAGSFYALGFFVLSQVLFRSTGLSQAGKVYGSLFHLHIAGGLGDILGASPYYFFFDCVAIALWILVAWLRRKTTDHSTPWFVGLCAALILLLGRLGSAHFIYATF